MHPVILVQQDQPALEQAAPADDRQAQPMCCRHSRLVARFALFIWHGRGRMPSRVVRRKRESERNCVLVCGQHGCHWP
jgi:hypothetical protein